MSVGGGVIPEKIKVRHASSEKHREKRVILKLATKGQGIAAKSLL